MKKLVILISGKLQSGKSQTATYLKEMYETKGSIVRMGAFAKPLKDAIVSDFKDLKILINSKVEKLRNIAFNIKTCGAETLATQLLEELEEMRFTSDNFYENKTDITRLLLQIYGTNIFRNRVSKDYWIDILSNECLNEKFDVMLITDVRFENEINKLKDIETNDLKVLTVRIERPNLPRNNINNQHSSETGLDYFNKWDYIINNDSSLESLKEKIKNLFDEL